MGTRERDRDPELLIPVATISENGASNKSSAPPATPTMSSSHGHEASFKSNPQLGLEKVYDRMKMFFSGGISVPKLFTTVDPSGIEATRIVNFISTQKEKEKD